MKKKAPKIKSTKRATRGIKRSQFHVLLNAEERKKLTHLAEKNGLNSATVVRALIMHAA